MAAGPAARIVCSGAAAALIDLWGLFNGWRLLPPMTGARACLLERFGTTMRAKLQDQNRSLPLLIALIFAELDRLSVFHSPDARLRCSLTVTETTTKIGAWYPRN